MLSWLISVTELQYALIVSALILMLRMCIETIYLLYLIIRATGNVKMHFCMSIELKVSILKYQCINCTAMNVHGVYFICFA